MDRQKYPFETSQDITMAAAGIEQMLDDKTLFCTPAPLAASTVHREFHRGRPLVAVDTKGSFLDDMSRLSIQSACALDITNRMKQMDFNTNSGNSSPEGAPARDSGPDLIQFSGAAVDVGNADQDTSKSDSLTDTSSKSSMGLIPPDMLNVTSSSKSSTRLISSSTDSLNNCDFLAPVSEPDMSASVLPLTAPKMNIIKETRCKDLASVHFAFKEKAGNSSDWSDNSKQDSKQDSKDLPMGRSHLETVKKRPQQADSSKENAPVQLTARDAVSLFGKNFLHDVQEGEELDQSLYNVELGDEDLKQLDADVAFSDLEEDHLSLEEGRESGDEDFDFDEPMLSVPARELEEGGSEHEKGAMAWTHGKVLPAQLSEAEGRLGEGQESEEEELHTKQTVLSNSALGLDSRYFRNTPLSFAGDGEDIQVTSIGSNIVSTSQLRGDAEGEHQLTKLRRQFMTGGGSPNTIHTDDVKDYGKTQDFGVRERGQGAGDDGDHNNLCLPVGLDNGKQSGTDNQRCNQGDPQQSLFSFLTRQSAEGGAAHSPLPWDGGEGGDGSSGGDSEGESKKKAGRSLISNTSTAVSGQQNDSDRSDQLICYGVKNQSGLHPEFFLPTSTTSLLMNSEVISSGIIDGSTFNVEDILQSETDAAVAGDNRQNYEPRLAAPGSNAGDITENPFEGQFAGSFGSFGINPDGDDEDKLDSCTESDTSKKAITSEMTSKCHFVNHPQPADCVRSLNAHPEDSHSFDGPFRKPLLPAPSQKRNDKKETYTADSRSVPSLEYKTLLRTEDQANLDKEFAELGIHVGDEDFQTAGAAWLDNEEKQFEEENKFSEHHNLALAAEGLAWGSDESHLSGYLGGEDNPEHLETTIGAYMASRTEALGTLGGDHNVPRPYFGKAVQSPSRPHPVKLMSPPSSASSILSLDSRTEGEGNEDGNRTLVTGNSAMQAHNLKSSQSIEPSQPVHKQVTVVAVSENETIPKAALKEELSPLFLDLTSNCDLSVEDALSMSAVFEFMKNHSYTKSSDFATAIMKLSKSKQQQGNREAKKRKLERTVSAPSQKQEKVKSLHSEITTGNGKSLSSQSSVSDLTANQVVNNTISTPSSLCIKVSEKSRVSIHDRVPSSSAHNKIDKPFSAASSESAASAGQFSDTSHVASLHLTASNESQRLGHIASAVQNSVYEQKLVNPKTTLVKKAVSQKQSKTASESSAASMSGNGAKLPCRDMPTCDYLEKDGSAESSASVRLDKNASKQNVMISNTQASLSSSVSWTNEHITADRQIHQKQNRQKLVQYADRNQELRETDQSKSFDLEPIKQLTDAPLNIPICVQKEKHTFEENMKEHESGISNGSLFSTDVQCSERDRNVSKSLTTQYLMLTPPQRLAEHSSNSTVLEARELVQIEHLSSNQISPRGNKYNHHIPDGMENSVPASASIKGRGGLSREKAVGMDIGDLMESRQFDMIQAEGEGLQKKYQQLQSALKERLQQQTSRPTLLTSSSLLETQFAQKYLMATSSDRQTHTRDNFASSKATRIFPDHLPGDMNSRVSSKLKSTIPQPLSNSVYSNSKLTTSDIVYPHAANQKALPPNSSQPVNESTVSMYYELNEDPHQSTILGGESSALGSFWGKSPLYKSTPAFELGKVAAISMMGSRLDEQDLTTPGMNMVTPSVQRQLIDVQRSIDFPEFCCLGVSQKILLPVTNRSAFGVACRFRPVKLHHNGKMIIQDLQSPFQLKSKLSISPGASESIPVLFVPKCPGEHMCQVEVFAQSLNPTLQPTLTVIQIRAFAEVPHIQISPSVEILKYGEVMWGGCISKTLKLRNTSKSSIPVRLSIWSSGSVWNCFTFDSSDNTDMSIISMSNRPEALGRNVTTVILPGCDSLDSAKTVEICIYCRPPKKEISRVLAERPADKIEAKVDVEVDTPVQYLPPLASVKLQAIVGIPRLLIPSNRMSLIFKTEPNKNIQDGVLVNNSGNINMNLALSVTTFPECFKISPSSLTIKPGGQAEVTIIFSPLEYGIYKYQSLLLLDVEPGGPSYEIPIEVEVTQTMVRHPAPLSILSSKSFLSFNGVPLNQTKSLNLRLFNKDNSQAEYASVEIRQSSDCFKLVSASGEWQQKCEVVIEPKEKLSLTVIFCPTAVKGYSGKVVIRKQDMPSSAKYSIPLSGYGGRSVLALSGACLTNSGQRWLELGSLSVGHNIMQEVVLTNSGVRAAFIRATAFHDMPCRQAVQPGRLAIEPNNFILASGCSTVSLIKGKIFIGGKVLVVFNPSQLEVDLVKDRREVVAVVQFQHGDEVMRQKYKRACSKDDNVDQHSWQAAFQQEFTNEDQDSVILEGHSIPESPDDTMAFFHHLSSQCVALLAEPSRNKEPSSELFKTKEGELPSQPTRDREDSRHYGPSSRPESDEGDWTVKPDFLSFTVEDNNHKMLQLINFSKQFLRFELSWPPSSVVPEPQKGELKPRSSTTIEVWLHMAWQKRLAELPWRGEVTINCNGQQKTVRIHIEIAAQSSRRALTSPRSSPASVSIRSPRDTSFNSSGRSLQLASTNIHFSNARINGVHDHGYDVTDDKLDALSEFFAIFKVSVLELTNPSSDPMHWKITAFAPPYVKGADENNTVQRVGYDVFIISPSSADLLPQETMEVPVKFCPKTKGIFNQHWEIEYQPLTAGKMSLQDKSTTKISLTAEVSSWKNLSSRKPTWDVVNPNRSNAASSRIPLQEKQSNSTEASNEQVSSSNHELQLMNENVNFTSTKVGQVTQVKIEFKNSLDHNVELEVDAPKPPFRIKHKTFKITKKRFLKYPIEFGPTVPGTFTDTVVFRAAELGRIYTVHLKGIGL